MSFWQNVRAIGACAILTIAPLASQASVVAMPGNTPRFGPIHFHPKSITIGLESGKSGGASFRVSQKGYEGRFRGIIQCQVGLLKQPRIDIDGHTVTIIVPAQRVVVSVGCYATIEGGDGATGEEPILIDIGLD
jgi:hypothetical protein